MVQQVQARVRRYHLCQTEPCWRCYHATIQLIWLLYSSTSSSNSKAGQVDGKGLELFYQCFIIISWVSAVNHHEMSIDCYQRLSFEKLFYLLLLFPWFSINLMNGPELHLPRKHGIPLETTLRIPHHPPPQLYTLHFLTDADWYSRSSQCNVSILSSNPYANLQYFLKAVNVYIDSLIFGLNLRTRVFAQIYSWLQPLTSQYPVMTG